MPVLIEGAFDLVVVLGCLVLIGMLLAVDNTFVPLLRAIASIHFYFIPNPFKGTINRVATAISNAIGSAVQDLQQVIADLWMGLVWSWGEMVHAYAFFSNQVSSALEHLRDATIPGLINAAIGDIRKDIATLQNAGSGVLQLIANATRNAEAFTLKQIDIAEAKFAGTLDTAEGYADHAVTKAVAAVEHDITTAVNDLGKTLTRRIDNVEGSLQAKITAAQNAAEAAARAYAGNLLDDALHAGGRIDSDIHRIVSAALTSAIASGGSIEQVVTKAARAAVDAAIPAGVATIAEVQHQIASALAGFLSAGYVTGPEVESLIRKAVAGIVVAGGITTDEVQALIGQAVDAAIGAGSPIQDLLGRLQEEVQRALDEVEASGVAGIAATVTALAATVTAVLAETGLENPGCRPKIKSICGTNPLAWERLLAGLVPLGFAFTFDDLADVARNGFAAAGDIVDELR